MDPLAKWTAYRSIDESDAWLNALVNRDPSKPDRTHPHPQHRARTLLERFVLFNPSHDPWRDQPVERATREVPRRERIARHRHQRFELSGVSCDGYLECEHEMLVIPKGEASRLECPLHILTTRAMNDRILTRLPPMSPFARTAQDCIRHRLHQSGIALSSLNGMGTELEALIEVVKRTLGDGRLILTCGNGGSAAEALHFSEELIGRYRLSREPLKSICLCADTTALTCIGNDFGFDQIYSRQVKALASKGDLLIVLSTSGNSPNILRALETARACGARSIGLLGGDGGKARALCDHALVVAGVDGAAAQEIHQMVIHMICESLEPA